VGTSENDMTTVEERFYDDEEDNPSNVGDCLPSRNIVRFGC
jgi:hypothetical protein